MQPYWPDTLAAQVDVFSKVVTVTFGVIGGIWVYLQYREATRLRAADTLLKVEEEFRHVLPIFEQIEVLNAYQNQIAPVLSSYLAKGDADVNILASLDRMLRFLYLCSVLDHTLSGESGTALQKAYYYYLGMLLPEQLSDRPELLAYTRGEYPRLTRWIADHRSKLIEFRMPRAPTV